jgi:hypothetical protein
MLNKQKKHAAEQRGVNLHEAEKKLGKSIHDFAFIVFLSVSGPG